MNWGECKLLALQKIDPAINSLNSTRNTKDYLNAMVGVANRGLQDLATAGKYIVKKYEIVQPQITNVLANPMSMFNTYQKTEDMEYKAIGKAYYFEVEGKANIELYVGDELVNTIENETKYKFTAYKGFFDNPENKEVTIKFVGLYPYQYRNVAIYNVNFETEEDIWDFVTEKRYDLRALTDDFYKLVSTDLVLQSGIDKTRYKKTQEYYWEGDSVLVLNGLEQASWTVHYYAYPQMVNAETPNETELPLDPEVAVLLPLYMASQLMEDDDSDMAYYFYQQYTEAKMRLSASYSLGRATFLDMNGW